MSTVSGSGVFYKFDLHGENPVSSSIWMHADRTIVEGNYVRLMVHPSGSPQPLVFQEADHIRARDVINELYERNVMSIEDRSSMENALCEVEKGAYFASKRVESISPAQKDIIKDFVYMYVADIKSEAPDSQTAKKWIQNASNSVEYYNNGSQENISPPGKSKDFYDSLLTIVRVYHSRANLEATLEQTGGTLPSAALVQEAILELFD